MKCDEAKPTCERCEAANVECAGYEQKRQIRPRRSRHGPRTESGSPEEELGPMLGSAAKSTPESAPESSHHAGLAVPSYRDDGLPLVALPANPRADQRPVDQARNVLAYHQLLFRTLPLLFPPEHLPFWRDKLCEEAWSTEYAFLALIALGGMHRAALMISMPGEDDRDRGIDTKVIAVHVYTDALQALASNLASAKRAPIFLVAVLCIMAYFEVSLLGLCPPMLKSTFD